MEPGITKPEAAVRIGLKRLHPFIVLNRLGVHVDHLKVLSESETRIPDLAKQDMFDDAHRSLHYNLRTEVYPDEGELSRKAKTSLNQWLELLKLTLPPAWTARKVINAILNDFRKATSGKEDFLRIIDKYPPPKGEWSESCSKGNKGQGYTCGLWHLLHMTTVGVVEFNRLLEDDQDELAITTGHAAEVIRKFLANFFSSCPNCQKKFQEDFTSCALDRCKRLSSTHGETMDQWMELPVWLFEAHNLINVMKDKAENGEIGRTQQDGVQKLWPPGKDCPACWLRNVTWDTKVMFEYLRISYW